MQDRSYKVEFLLCLFGGMFGFHKFYERKYAQGILYFLTAGLFIFGWIIDIFKLFPYAFVYSADQIEEYEALQIERIKEKEIEKQEKKKEKAEMNRVRAEQFIQERKDEGERIKTMKKQGVVFCPKCHSTSITAQNKRLSIGRAAVGGVLLGGTGAVLGGLSSKKIKKVCLNCGHKWS